MDESLSQRMLIPAGQTILRQGDLCENYLSIISGSVQIIARSPQGREISLYTIHADESCVLTTSCLLSGHSFPAEALAVTDVEVELVSKAIFDEKLSTSSVFRERVFKNFGERLKHLILKIEEVTSESIPTRVAKFLLDKSSLELFVTHQQMAQEIGSSREVVSRCLKQMERNGALRLSRGKILIINRDYLLSTANDL